MSEERIKFLELLIAFLKNRPVGAIIGDPALTDLCRTNSIRITKQQTMEYIRRGEAEIGKQLKIRLHRLRNEGYQVLEGEAQILNISKIAGHKIYRAAKQADERLDAVDTSGLSISLKNDVASKQLALRSFKQIVEHSIKDNVIEMKQVRVLESAANELRALEQLKKVGV